MVVSDDSAEESEKKETKGKATEKKDEGAGSEKETTDKDIEEVKEK